MEGAIRFILALFNFALGLVLATVSAVQQIPLPDAAPASSPSIQNATSSPEQSQPAPTTFPEAEQSIFEQLNAERTSAGLASLTLDPALTEIARLRAADMLARNYVSHYDPVTGDRADWALEQQHGQPLGAEIIYWTSGSADRAAARAVPWWIGSDEHRAIVLGEYGRGGVGVAEVGGKVIVVGLSSS